MPSNRVRPPSGNTTRNEDMPDPCEGKIKQGATEKNAMEEAADVETESKLNKVLAVTWLITKKTLGIFWLVIKWFFKAIWWIMKNFKVQTTSLNK